MSNIVEAQQNVEQAKQEQPEEIRIEVIRHEDTDEILTMLKEFFFKVCVRTPIESFQFCHGDFLKWHKQFEQFRTSQWITI